jgi:hypothetical protein
MLQSLNCYDTFKETILLLEVLSHITNDVLSCEDAAGDQ